MADLPDGMKLDHGRSTLSGKTRAPASGRLPDGLLADRSMKARRRFALQLTCVTAAAAVGAAVCVYYEAWLFLAFFVVNGALTALGALHAMPVELPGLHPEAGRTPDAGGRGRFRRFRGPGG